MKKKEDKDDKHKEPKLPKDKHQKDGEEIVEAASEDPVPGDRKHKKEEPEVENKEVTTPDAEGEYIGPTAIPRSGNTHLRRLMDVNFLEYASYVIKDRAIPDVDDGLKPVQRRIMWSLKRMDDGKYHKVANVVGHTMQLHPHGDASIYEALVVVANKEYFIDW